MNRVKILTENEAGVLVDSAHEEVASVHGPWMAAELTKIIHEAREVWKP